jgi:hypothetical protein
MLKARNAVFGVAAIGAVIALTGCSDKTHGDTSTLKLTEPGGKSGTFGIIGNPTRGRISPGQGFAFSTPLQDASHSSVGALDVICIATQPSAGGNINGTCTGTATVPGGSLAVAAGGKGVTGGNVTGSITGGTAKYAGATGTFTSQKAGSGGNAPNNDTFNITLP